MYVAPRGTLDILPEDQPYWRHLYDNIATVTALYGYRRIDLPIFEDTALYERGVGQGTDIVDKEMYSFRDKGDRDITLRPEFTAGVVRAYLQHGMKTWPQPVKLYTTGPIFRYERVQAGRYRQHTQFDIECIGERDPAVDFEVMSVAWALFSRVGFVDLSYQINSTGCPRCRPSYLKVLVEYYQRRRPAICQDCERRLERNPLRLLDCKTPSCQPVIEAAPQIGEQLCPDCRTHFDTLRGYLDGLGRPYVVNHRLVRGLDYYTNTVFEVLAAGIGAQNAVCGGGRYDGLAEELGGNPTPGIGFGSGMERLVLMMKDQGVPVPGMPGPEVSVVYLGAAAKLEALRLLEALRAAGLRANLEFGDRSLKAQLRGASRDAVRYALILGDDEVAAGQVALRDMQDGAPQELLIRDGVVPVIAQRLRAGG